MSEPQNPGITARHGGWVCHSRAGEAETSGPLGLTRQSGKPTLQAPLIYPVLKKQDG